MPVKCQFETYVWRNYTGSFVNDLLHKNILTWMCRLFSWFNWNDWYIRQSDILSFFFTQPPPIYVNITQWIPITYYYIIGQFELDLKVFQFPVNFSVFFYFLSLSNFYFFAFSFFLSFRLSFIALVVIQKCGLLLRYVFNTHSCMKSWNEMIFFHIMFLLPLTLRHNCLIDHIFDFFCCCYFSLCVREREIIDSNIITVKLIRFFHSIIKII